MQFVNKSDEHLHSNIGFEICSFNYYVIGSFVSIEILFQNFLIEISGNCVHLLEWCSYTYKSNKCHNF